MNTASWLQVMAIIHFICVGLATHAIIGYQEKFIEKTDFIQEHNYISCSCRGKNITSYIARKDFGNMKQCNQSGDNKICLLYKICQKCSFYMVECKPNSIFHNKYDCRHTTFEIYKKTSAEIKKTVIKDFTTQHRLTRRDLPYCVPPDTAEIQETADIICRKYDSYIRCAQICMQGYTLEKGVWALRRCKYKEDKWKPKGFKACRPYVDCGMTLIHPGKLNCAPGSTDSFKTCNVTCYDFEGRSATPMQTFECGITGTWDKQPPFCVIPKGGLLDLFINGENLVPPPKNFQYPSEEDFIQP